MTKKMSVTGPNFDFEDLDFGNNIGTYEIRNLVNSKRYVGSSKELLKRFNRHLHELKNNIHHNIYLQRAWNKYGSKNFCFSVLDHSKTEKDARVKEQKLLDIGIQEKILYNLSGSATGGDFLANHPKKDEIIARRSKTTKEKNKKLTPEERKKKFSKPGEKNGMYGRNHTAEARKKISEANIQRFIDNGYVGATKGYKHTEETKKRLSEKAKLRTGEKKSFLW